MQYAKFFAAVSTLWSLAVATPAPAPRPRGKLFSRKSLFERSITKSAGIKIYPQIYEDVAIAAEVDKNTDQAKAYPQIYGNVITATESKYGSKKPREGKTYPYVYVPITQPYAMIAAETDSSTEKPKFCPQIHPTYHGIHASAAELGYH